MTIARRLTTPVTGATLATAILLFVAHPSSVSSAQESNGRGATWVTAWSTSQQALGDTNITNATVRIIARVTIPGDGVRIRLDNTFGTAPVTVGSARIGYRVQGPALAAGSNRSITFNGTPQITIPPAGSIWSDSVRLPVLAQQDLAVSLYIPGLNARPSQHTGAVVTSYRSAVVAESDRRGVGLVARHNRRVWRFHHGRYLQHRRCARPLGGRGLDAPRRPQGRHQ